METGKDIVEEMRRTRPDCDDCLSNHMCEYLIGFANRLDAAYKRDLQAMVDAGERDMRTAMDKVDRLTAENERLKAALKPVLDCITDGIVLTNDESSCAEGFDECMSAVDAVDEAKRIYNGGAK